MIATFTQPCMPPSCFSHIWLCVQPYGLQLARLFCPWDSPGKNTGVGCLVPPPGDLPNPGIKPVSLMSLPSTEGFFTTSSTYTTMEKAWIKPHSRQKTIQCSTSLIAQCRLLTWVLILSPNSRIKKNSTVAIIYSSNSGAYVHQFMAIIMALGRNLFGFCISLLGLP